MELLSVPRCFVLLYKTAALVKLEAGMMDGQDKLPGSNVRWLEKKPLCNIGGKVQIILWDEKKMNIHGFWDDLNNALSENIKMKYEL